MRPGAAASVTGADFCIVRLIAPYWPDVRQATYAPPAACIPAIAEDTLEKVAEQRTFGGGTVGGT
jgi:hypothetical protein